MLTGRAAAKVGPSDQEGGAAIFRLLQDEVTTPTPVVEEERPVAGALDPLQKLFRNDLVGIDVRPVERSQNAIDPPERFHQLNSRTSTRCPAIAPAAAIGGLTRWVRPPLPCRPSKFRLLVEAQRSPGPRMSGFMPRHIEQPASRHSKPAWRKTASSPSASACRLTLTDPGTTIARTFGCTEWPRTTVAARRRSSRRALVQEPMKTRSIAIVSIAVPGSSAM